MSLDRSSSQIEQSASSVRPKITRPVLTKYNSTSGLTGFEYFYDEEHICNYVVDNNIVIYKEIDNMLIKLEHKDKMKILTCHNMLTCSLIKANNAILLKLFNFFTKKLKYKSQGHSLEFKSKPTNLYGLGFRLVNVTYHHISQDYKISIVYESLPDNIRRDNTDTLFENVFVYDKNLYRAIKTVLLKLNQLIFCTNCGKVNELDNFDMVDKKCLACGIEDFLFEDATEVENCSICQSEVKKFYLLYCGHKFHRSCLSNISDPKVCPNCRAPLNRDDTPDLQGLEFI